MLFEQLKNEFEQVVYCNDAKTGLRAIVAMHSTVLGPAVGGCRMWAYKNEAEAINDVLRLSRGMTYKAAISGLKWGGGKAVIIGNPKTDKTQEKLERFGQYVERLGGNYVTAKDVGIDANDLRIIKNKTQYVLGIEGESGSSGDPSPATAWGVFHGMRTCAKQAFGADTLKNLKIAIQGLGSVSYYLMEHLMADGAKLVGCDIDASTVDRAVKRYGVEIVKPEAIYDVQCDIFSPNALGAIINKDTIQRLRTKVVAGGANNQLATSEDGFELMRKGIMYAPDYAINAGGLTNIYHESEIEGGYSRTKAFEHVAKIGGTTKRILERSKAEKRPPHEVADNIVQERLRDARG